MHRLTATRGFTLIELLFVFSIIGLLASVVFTSLTSARLKARIGAGQTQNTAIVRAIGDSLVGEWRLNETAGTTAVDSSGNNYTATMVGTLSFENGVEGGAFAFPGGSNYLSVAAAEGLEFRGKSAITVTAWVKPAATVTGTQTIAGRNVPYLLWITGTNRISFPLHMQSPSGWNFNASSANNVVRPVNGNSSPLRMMARQQKFI